MDTQTFPAKDCRLSEAIELLYAIDVALGGSMHDVLGGDLSDRIDIFLCGSAEKEEGEAQGLDPFESEARAASIEEPVGEAHPRLSEGDIYCPYCFWQDGPSILVSPPTSEFCSCGERFVKHGQA